MIRITPAGALTATSYALTTEIVEKLTRSYCANASQQPTITTAWSIADTQLVGTTMFATVQAIVTVTYQPKCSRTLITNTYKETFEVSFAGASATSTITPTPTTGYTDPAYVNICNCNTAQGVKSVGTLTLAFTA